MPKVNLPIGLGYYRSNSSPIADLICDNCYPNWPQIDAPLSQQTLYGTAGLNQLITSGIKNQINRGSHVKAGKPYFMQGETLYRLDRTIVDEVESLSLVNLGTIPGTSRLSFADNGRQLMIVDPDTGNGWIVNEDIIPIFQQITDPRFTANGLPQYVVFIDSFFVCSTDSKRFVKSEASNGLVWIATDTGTAEKDPDDIVAPVTFRGELFIAGTETIQSFNIDPSAGADFPYRASGLVIPKGCFAPNSLIEVNDSFMWIGGAANESPAIWKFSGSPTPAKVSTTAIDDALLNFTDDEISQAFAWQYAQAGAYFIGFSFPQITLVYDTISQRWHTRSSTIQDAAGFVLTQRWRVNSLVTAYGRILVADSIDGRIGELDLNIYDEYGENIRRTVTTINMSNDDEAAAYPEIEATIESGIGDFETDPQLRLSWSDDGGKTYSNELTRGMGKIGQYTRRCVWSRLGRAPRYRLWKLEYSEKYKFSFIALKARVKGGIRGR